MSQEIYHHIFLSYSRKDTDLMQRMRDDLRSSDLYVWTDENLEPGTRAWETSIARAIRNAGCMVVLLTPDSEQSEWVGRELAYAETLNVRIFPILARGSERDAVPFRLISHQWIDARRSYDHALDALVLALNHYLIDFRLAEKAVDRPSGVTGLLHPPLHPTQVPDDAEPIVVKPIWTFKADGGLRSAPVIYNNGVFFGSIDGYFHALQLRTGQSVWSFKAKGAVLNSPVISEKRQHVLFGANDSFFYALDCRTGKQQWSFLAGNKIQGAPTVSQEEVFFGSDDGTLYALALTNGRLQRSYPSFSPLRTRPLITDEIVIFGLENGEVLGLELSGSRKWRYKTKGWVFTSPAADLENKLCFFGSTDNTLTALNMHSGTVAWRFSTTGKVLSPPLFHDGVLYFGSGDGNIYALTTSSGTQKWSFKTGNAVVAPPVWHNGRLYVGGTDGVFYCLDARTGREAWNFTTDASITAGAVVAGDKVLVAASDGTLYALKI